MKNFGNFGNFWKEVVLRKISGTFVFENITSTSPPPLKNFCFPEKFFGGALERKGAQILEYTPPTGNLCLPIEDKNIIFKIPSRIIKIEVQTLKSKSKH
jgi:hypothetical protein